MRRVVGILGACVAASIVWGNVFAEMPETTPETKPEIGTLHDEHSTPQISEEIRQRLHASISLKLDKVPLEDALNEILRKNHFDYWIDQPKLDEESIRLDTVEVTCDVQNVSIRALLKRILRQARLSWVCEDAGILITTETAQQATYFARIYDVGDLLETPEIEVAAPALPHQEVQFGGQVEAADKTPETAKPPEAASGGGMGGGSGGMSGGMGGMGGGMGGGHMVTAPSTPESILIDTIQGAIGGPPHAPWMDADGEGGSVHLIVTAHAKLLVIRQHEQCHAEIEDLLNELVSHQRLGEEGNDAPAAKNASRKIVPPRVRIVSKRIAR